MLGLAGSVVAQTATGPRVIDARPPNTGIYHAGHNLTIALNYDAPVFVTGVPRVTLSLDSGSYTEWANYVSGSGTTQLVFRYDVVYPRMGGAGVHSAIDLNGGTIRGANGLDAQREGFYLGGTDIVIDTSSPGVPPTLSPFPFPTGAVGVQYFIIPYFNEAPNQFTLTGAPPGIVIDPDRGWVRGTPTEAGNWNATLQFSNPFGSTHVTIPFQVLPAGAPAVSSLQSGGQAGRWMDTSFPLAFQSPVPANFGSSELPAGLKMDPASGRITGIPQVAGVFWPTYTATNAGGTAMAIQRLEISAASGPVVTGVIGPAAGNYNRTQVLTFAVTYSQPVTVEGRPTIAFSVDTTSNQRATYISGSGTSTLLFEHVVNYHIGRTGLVIDRNIATWNGRIYGPDRAPAMLSLPDFDVAGIRLNASPPVIVSTGPAFGSVGTNFAYGVAATQFPRSVNVAALPPGLTYNANSGVIAGTPTVAGDFSVTLNATNDFGADTETLRIAISPAPTTLRTLHRNSPDAIAWGEARWTYASWSSGTNYVWYRNGVVAEKAEGSALIFRSMEPSDSAIYHYDATTNGFSTPSYPAILALATGAKVIGAGAEVGTDIHHENGNIYDQVLLEGAAVAVTANRGQVVRLSFIDPTDDIVQVEFSGAGTLSVTLDGATGPAAPTHYRQPGVAYMKGTARLVVMGAGASTNLSVFSVGRTTAIDQAIFRDDVTYDGFADIASIAIASADGKFGGLRAGNASFVAINGLAGVHAPDVDFQGPVYIGEIAANDAATPVLRIGGAAETWITGGDLAQPNGRAVQVLGLSRLEFKPGTNSHGGALPAQRNRARIEEDFDDVTDDVVLNP